MKKIISVILLSALLGSPSATCGTTREGGEAARGPVPGPDLSFLTTEEMRTYQYGEISTGSHVGGGLVGTFIGLGLGHIFYGRYSDRGWIFTVGQLGSFAVMVAGLANAGLNCSLGDTRGCSGGLGLYTFGAFAFLGLRVWEIVDVWTLPASHNSEYRAIRERVDQRGVRTGSGWALHPIVSSADGSWRMGLGLAARF